MSLACGGRRVHQRTSPLVWLPIAGVQWSVGRTSPSTQKSLVQRGKSQRGYCRTGFRDTKVVELRSKPGGYVNLMWPHHGGLKWPHPPEQPMRSLCCSRSHVEDRGRSFVKARANCPFARSRIRSVSVASCDSHSVYHRLALKNGRRALTSAVGASSAIWWPESIPNPWTSSAHDFHMSSGLP